MSPHPRIVLRNNKCSINICRVNELICTFNTPVGNERNDITGSEILGFWWFPWFCSSCLLLKVRMMGRYQSQLFCRQGQRYIMNCKPARSWALFCKCSLSRLRNDYFHVSLASPVCHMLMPSQQAVTSCSPQHTLLEGNHAIVLYSSVIRPATGTPQSSHFPLWFRKSSSELFLMWTPDSFPSCCVVSQNNTDHTRDVFSTCLATVFSC